jgi:hypothetical protein
MPIPDLVSLFSSSAAGRQIAYLLVGLAFLEIRNQGAQLRIPRIEGEQLAGVAEWDELDLGLEHTSRCERVAIVTDIGWVRLTVKALRFLIPSEIRVFPTDQADEGRAWIMARPRPQMEVEAGTAAPVRARRVRPRRVRRSSAPASPRIAREQEQTAAI